MKHERIARDKAGKFLAKNDTKPAAARRQTEGAIQKTFATWCRFNLRDDVDWFAIANEGRLSPRMGARMRDQGVRTGVADFAVIWRGKIHFIEFKASGGYQSTPQREFEARCGASGAAYGVARSSGQAIALLDAWGVPHRDLTERKP